MEAEGFHRGSVKGGADGGGAAGRKGGVERFRAEEARKEAQEARLAMTAA
jgi:hypothetical protein